MRMEITLLIAFMVVLLLAGTLTIFSISTVQDTKINADTDESIFASMKPDMSSLGKSTIPMLFKHGVYLLIGIAAFLFMVHTDYHRLAEKRVLRLAVLLTTVLLLLTFVPPFGGKINGAYRWLTWGPISVQPSELAKFVLVVWLAVSLTVHQDKITHFGQGFVLPFCLAGFFVSIVLVQRDIGIPFVMLTATFAMVWVAGGRLRYLLGSCAICLAGGIMLIIMQPYRLVRIYALIDPWKYRETIGFQLIQSLVALSQGGFWGRGPGASEQKLGYLPAADTDFIFATLGEEFGLIGTMTTVALFLGILYIALRICANAPDLFGALLGVGITVLLLIQTAFIIAVTVGIAPTKGLPLPFISYGGSALTVSLLMMGVLVNIGIRGALAKPEPDKKITVLPWSLLRKPMHS